MIINHSIRTRLAKNTTVYVSDVLNSYIKMPSIRNYNFNTNDKKYNSCLFCVTNTDDLTSLFTFIFYHKVICKFDKIVIADNLSLLKIYNLTKVFDNVDYFDARLMKGQSDIYNKYLQYENESKYITFIDDDEFFYISDKYSNDINKFLESINPEVSKIAIPWILIYSKSLLEKRTQNILEFSQYYCPDEETYDLNNNIWTSNYIKTILNTTDTEHYFYNDNSNLNVFKTLNQLYETNLIDSLDDLDITPRSIGVNPKNEVFIDVMGTVHNPYSLKNKQIQLVNDLCTNKKIVGIKRSETNEFYVNNSDILLMHYKYRSIEEYTNKIAKSRFYDIDSNYYNVVFNLNYINKQYKKPLKTFDKIFNLFNKYKNEFNSLHSKLVNEY